jgi:hypothetical protein
VLDNVDARGMTMRDALRDAGLDPAQIAAVARRPEDVLAYAELHIEQGPVLEAEGLATGVVTAINGGNRFQIELKGMAGHAGNRCRWDCAAMRWPRRPNACSRSSASPPRCLRSSPRGPHRGVARSDERHPRPSPVFAGRARACRRPAARGRRGNARRL